MKSVKVSGTKKKKGMPEGHINELQIKLQKKLFKRYII
jgi:hypothetical protein